MHGALSLTQGTSASASLCSRRGYSLCSGMKSGPRALCSEGGQPQRPHQPFGRGLSSANPLWRATPPFLGCLAAAAFGSWAAKHYGSRHLLQAGVQRQRSTEADRGWPARALNPATDSLVAASSSDSDDSTSTSQVVPAVYVLETGASMIPHPDKVDKGGEDSYFITANQDALGVADGVGGWSLTGVDAGIYARLLMKRAQVHAEAGTPNADLPQNVLIKAHAETDVQGSCTACIVVLEHDMLHACNLGDSGFMVVRKGAPWFQSPVQQHRFNHPFQLGFRAPMSDPPERSERFSIPLRSGDIIVLGTDGLLDNVFPHETAALVAHVCNRGVSAEGAAISLAQLARNRAHDPQHMTPFAYSATQSGIHYHGGKPDDITVLVAYVRAAAVEPPQ